MQQLKERILKEGRVLPGNIIKVDGFLNHRVDTALMGAMAEEFAKYFDVKNITMVLTAEASGIALATVCAEKYGVPMVFAKKAKSDKVLIIDDFMAKGYAMRGLIDIVNKAGATLAGIGVAVEKGFQDGGDSLRREGYPIHSLAIIDEADEHHIRFREDN